MENNYEPTALVTSFVPYSKNFVRVLVFNGAYDGPASEAINFVTPEGSKFLIWVMLICFCIHFLLLSSIHQSQTIPIILIILWGASSSAGMCLD